MIISFHFIALTSNRQINLDQGVVVGCQLARPILQGNLFACNIFLTTKQMILSKPRQLFWRFSQNQGQNNQE
jgi:hypothetical protein